MTEVDSMRRTIALALLLMAGCQSSCRDSLVARRLGQTEAQYVASYGPATKSPMTPDQVAYTIGPGGLLLTRVADGRSVEELWMLNDRGEGLPEVIARRAEALLNANVVPVRTVKFESGTRPAAEIFEFPEGDGVILLERRNGLLMRAALCAERGACRLLDQMLKGEQETDAWLARAAGLMQQK